MPFIVEQHGHVAVATLSRPEARNAWGPDFYDGIAEHFARWTDDDSVRNRSLQRSTAMRSVSAAS